MEPVTIYEKENLRRSVLSDENSPNGGVPKRLSERSVGSMGLQDFTYDRDAFLQNSVKFSEVRGESNSIGSFDRYRQVSSLGQ